MSIGDWLQRGRIYIDPLPIVADVFNVLKIIFNGDSAKADGTNKTLICFFFKHFSDRLGLSIQVCSQIKKYKNTTLLFK